MLLLLLICETIYVKDDKDFWWEVSKAIIANFFQTMFLIAFSILAWFVRKFIIKVCVCDCKKKDEENVFQV
jgi:predicted membrane protein